MPSSVNVPSSIEERQPLPRGELVLLVLARDPLLAAAEPSLLAALVQVLHQRAERRSRHERVGRGALGGHASSPARWSSTGSSTCIAVSVATARASSSSGASKFVISIPTSSESSSTESIRS